MRSRVRVAIGAVIAVACLVDCAHSAAAPRATTSSSASAIRSSWRYEVAIAADGESISITATFDEAPVARVVVDGSTDGFVEAVEVAAPDAWHPTTRSREGWELGEGCSKAPCRVRYRFALGRAADAIDDVDLAMRRGSFIEAPPSSWALHPVHDNVGDDLTPFIVHAPPVGDFSFATGLRPRPGAADSYEATSSDLAGTPFSVFGRLHVDRIELGRESVDVVTGAVEKPERIALDRRWVDGAAHTVATYYGRFPIDRAMVLAYEWERDEPFGWTLGNGGGSIALHVPEEMSDADVLADWVLVHEMVHLGFPTLASEHRWLREGMATYLGPLARVRAGGRSRETFWAEMLDGMPHGLPTVTEGGPSEGGIDGTDSWGRIYWGGTLFCLLLDLDIRERTQNVRSIDDAMRGVVAAGGDVSKRWTIDHAIEVADVATGTTAMRELYDTWRARAVSPDLDALWKELGIRSTGSTVTFDETAPKAVFRRGIEARATR